MLILSDIFRGEFVLLQSGRRVPGACFNHGQVRIQVGDSWLASSTQRACSEEEPAWATPREFNQGKLHTEPIRVCSHPNFQQRGALQLNPKHWECRRSALVQFHGVQGPVLGDFHPNPSLRHTVWFGREHKTRRPASCKGQDIHPLGHGYRRHECECGFVWGLPLLHGCAWRGVNPWSAAVEQQWHGHPLWEGLLDLPCYRWEPGFLLLRWPYPHGRCRPIH